MNIDLKNRRAFRRFKPNKSHEKKVFEVQETGLAVPNKKPNIFTRLVNKFLRKG